MCRSISLISDLAKGVYKLADFKQLPANITKITASLNQMRETRNKNQNSLKASGKFMLTKIKALRKALNQLLDKLEKRTVEQMDSVLAELDGSLQKDIDHCDLLHDQLKALLDTIQACGNDSESHSYIGYRKCQDKMEEANKLFLEMATKPEMTVMLKPDTEANQLLSDLTTLGSMKLFHTNQVFKVKGKKTFEAKLSTDHTVCDILAITELPGGEIVLLDNNNCRAKVLNSKYKVTSHCNLPEYPWDICHISNDQVAVAVDDATGRQEVHFLTVLAGTIKMTRKISVDHRCFSIRHHRGQLYVGSLTALNLYTTGGKLIKKIYEDTTKRCTVNHFALSTDGTNIIIPASSHQKVITIDNKGNILATLKDQDFNFPKSVYVSEGGHVFVCSTKSHTIVQVDQEGKEKLATLVRQRDGISFPKAVLYSSQAGGLIVGGAQNDILVVDLQ